MKSTILILFLLIISKATSTANSASSRSFSDHEPSTNLYFGLNMGNMNTDFPNAKNNSPSLSSAYSYSLFMGAIIYDNLAGELAYTKLGITDLGNSVYLKGSAHSLSQNVIASH